MTGRRPLKPGDAKTVAAVAEAIAHLRRARDLLHGAGAERAMARVRLALTSSEGALRHAERRAFRSQTETKES